MKRIIEIDREDLDSLRSTSMTIDEMYNTLKGRIYCAVAGSKDLQNIDINESPGHWERWGETHLYKCSKCHSIISTNSYRYCPYCGVRMI